MRTPREIVELFACRGGMRYEGEAVSQLQHAWQCAQLARQARAPSALQLAAWLHDLGHLLTDMPGSPTLVGVNDGHEHVSAAALQPLFGDDVTAPIALHVEAKRYLVTVRAGYFERLSADSIRSLALQGGPMSNEEAEGFLARPFSREAIRLRAWDDMAKAADWLPESEGAALSELADLVSKLS
jgi:phosphonate degradation associated HDIG domain protein